jgi:Predicted membrane protein
MKPDINWLAAIIFYLLFISGLVIFVILPAVEKHSLGHALIFGALFGLISYATYDLTNLATLKDWPLQVTIVDLIWGTVLASSISLITYLIANKI